MPAGIKYSTGLFYNLFFTLYPGLQNNMFIFSGKAAEIIGENDIEYEFGIFLSLGLEYRFSEGLKTELYFKRQTIFSEPESILINYIGLKIFLFKL